MVSSLDQTFALYNTNVCKQSSNFLLILSVTTDQEESSQRRMHSDPLNPPRHRYQCKHFCLVASLPQCTSVDGVAKEFAQKASYPRTRVFPKHTKQHKVSVLSPARSEGL